MYFKYKKYSLFVSLFFVTLLTRAQPGKEAWHWQFGQNCALDFNSGAPIVSIGSLVTNEGCASMSEPNSGQLLFYTDGVKVWDKNDQIMPNGTALHGSYTSTQSALIVPKPGSDKIYYIFTCDYQGMPFGACYSIVDINLNGGLGDVIIKNQLLTPAPVAEKLVGVRHCNGIDFWVIDHPLNSDAFNVYLVSSAGVTATPVVSHAGTYETTYFADAIGYLKASPNGKKLALCSEHLHIAEIYDFDNATGFVSNAVTIDYNTFEPYGVCFSPDNTKLYVGITSVPSSLYQYDLSSNIPATIIASQTTVFNGAVAAMQLASDGKIYCDVYHNPLAVINNPNGLGIACNFQVNAVQLASPSLALAGLPNFIDGGLLMRKDTFNILLCQTALPVTLSADSGVTGVQWLGGATTQTLSVSNYGNYWVSYLNSSGCMETDTFHVLQMSPPLLDVVHDTLICSNTFSISIQENATQANVSAYNWSDGFTQPIHTLSTSGLYWIDYTLNNSCVSRDSFKLSLYQYPIVSLGNDTTFCQGNIDISVSNSSSTYQWSNGSTGSGITVSDAGIYWVDVSSMGCISRDSIVITVNCKPPIVVVPNIFTPNLDEINDTWLPQITNESSITQYDLSIFDRWGLEVFKTEKYADAWDGHTTSGVNCVEGVYYYIITFEDLSAKKNTFLKGYLQLCR